MRKIIKLGCLLFAVLLPTCGYAQEKGIEIIEKEDGFHLLIDSRHLTSTVISHNAKALDLIAEYAPDLDVVGINSNRWSLRTSS